MDSIFAYQFFQNALIASVLSAFVCGIIGAYVVVRRIVFVSGGITHASFGGLGFGLYMGIDPILSASIVAILSALGISRLSHTGQMREDSAIASVWALGMALGILFISLTPGYASGLSSFLFGNILLVSEGDLVAMGIYALLLIGLLILCYRKILYSMFDADFAESRGIRARGWNALMLMIVALGLVLSIRSVGIMLLMSLLTLPQTIASQWTKDFKQMICLSVGICLFANVLGLFLSYYLLRVPVGVLIILILFALLLVSRLLGRTRPA